MLVSRKLFTRRKFLAAAGLCALGAGYAFRIEPRWLGVGRHEVKLSRSSGRLPLKLLQLSDLHASQVVSLGFIAEAVQLGLGLKPDLICLTGDFITRGYNQLDGYAEILRSLADSAPTVACLGNHDGGLWAGRRRGYPDTNRVREVLTKAGATLLHNAAKTIRVRDWDLTLVGVGDLWAGEMQPLLAFDSLQPAAGGATILLAHNPDSKQWLKPFAWDLMLCGHTHGGQVRLPFFGTPFAPVRDKRFVEGLHRWEERWIHITRGVGNLHGVRINCPPEISLLTLV